MVPWELLDSAPVPGSQGELRLYRRGEEFSIRLDRSELMNSRMHGSEEALATLACARVADRSGPRVLIGGLGMGYTTAAALHHLRADGRLVVAELVPAVVKWNRGPLADLAGRPIEDERVTVREVDVAQILKTEHEAYDAILLDVDNGPEGLTRKGNNWLYSRAGLNAALTALRPAGVLAVWSASPDRAFSQRLREVGFEVDEIHARARGARKGAQHMIWLAARLISVAILALAFVYGNVGAAAAPSRTEQTAASQRPNVILVLVDDQGYGDLSCHGNPVLKTPKLDRLWSQSIRLTDFHVTPMCTPSRGQIMTGRDALANGAMNVDNGRSFIRRGIPTMADIFAQNGYRTGLFGKWHLGDNYPYRPQDRGFQETVCLPSSHITAAADWWNNDYFNPYLRHNGAVWQYQGYSTDVLFGEATRWIKDCHRRNEPFFVYLPLNAVHTPLFVAEKYRQPYKHLPRYISGIFGMIANVDENMGRLDQMLAAEGLADNTILLFLTDNGCTAGVLVHNAGMRGTKFDLYEGGHRVPCFVRWPGGRLRAAGDAGELTECQDLLPTLIDLCGLKTPGDVKFDGINLAPWLRGQQQRLTDRMLVVQYSSMDAPRPKKGDAAVLWQRWRLIQNRELYDLRGDPAQQKNVAEQHPEVVVKMQTHYDRWWAGVEPRVNEFSPISLGAEAENPVRLCATDWEDVFLGDQLEHVRPGVKSNGHWNVLVEREGRYEILLCRWPREADLALTDAAPAFRAVDAEYPPGKALPIAQARLRIAGSDLTLPVAKDERSAVFHVRLAPGRTQLQTWFCDARGGELCGAYYVYVRRQ